MKNLILFLAFGILPSTLWSHEFTAEQFYPLHALVGTWKSERNSGAIFEVWQKQNDSTMLGYSFRVRNNDTSYLEKVVLSYREGKIVYQPTTMNQNNQQPVDFTLRQILNAHYQFENRLHDFPQMVDYEIRSADSLYASISGPTPGGEKTIQFNYRKVK